MRDKLLSTMLLVLFIFVSNNSLVYAEDSSGDMVSDLVPIESGQLYDQVTSVWSDIVLSDSQTGSCNIEIQNIQTSSKDASRFLWISMQIVSNTDIFSDYERASFSYLGDGALAYLTISDFESVSDFRSLLFCVGWDGLESAYDESMYNFDHETISNREFNEIVGQQSNEIEVTNNDYLWLYSCFPVDTLYKFDGNMGIVNFRVGFADDYDSGYRFAKILKNALYRISDFSSANGGLSFDTLDAICYDEDGNELIGCNITVNGSGEWTTNVLNYGAEDFKAGFRDADKNG